MTPAVSESARAVVSPGAIGERLGRYAIGASRDMRAVAELAAGEELSAAVVAIWQRRGWVAVATDVGLRLARRPRFPGRGRVHSFEWRDLTAIRSGPQRVAMSFGAEDVDLLAVAPHEEFVRLIETARDHEEGSRKPPVDEIRELAKKKLGRFMTFGLEAAIDGLPDRLEPEERVERLAGATLDFRGLLVLTDRRLLLLDIALRRERIWDAPRTGIEAAEPVDDGLRLLVRGHGEVALTDFLPPERRDEFATVLRPRST
jgi:hypothetical protein